MNYTIHKGYKHLHSIKICLAIKRWNTFSVIFTCLKKFSCWSISFSTECLCTATLICFLHQMSWHTITWVKKTVLIKPQSNTFFYVLMAAYCWNILRHSTVLLETVRLINLIKIVNCKFLIKSIIKYWKCICIILWLPGDAIIVEDGSLTWDHSLGPCLKK